MGKNNEKKSNSGRRDEPPTVSETQTPVTRAVTTVVQADVHQPRSSPSIVVSTDTHTAYSLPQSTSSAGFPLYPHYNSPLAMPTGPLLAHQPTNVEHRINKLEQGMETIIYLLHNQRSQQPAQPPPPPQMAPPPPPPPPPRQPPQQHQQHAPDPYDNGYENISDNEIDIIDSNNNNVCSDDIAGLFPTDKSGGSIDDALAVIANRACTDKPDDDFMKNIRDKYPKPENCNKVVAPELEKKLFNCGVVPPGQQRVKHTERVLRNAQSVLTDSVYAQLRVVDSLKQLVHDSPDCDFTKELYETSRDAMLMACNSSFRLSVARRDNVKSLLDEKNVDVTDPSVVPITDKLFGDDLVKSCKEAFEARAALSKVLKKPTSTYTPSSSSVYRRNNSGKKQDYFRGTKPAWSKSSYRGRSYGYNNYNKGSTAYWNPSYRHDGAMNKSTNNVSNNSKN